MAKNRYLLDTNAIIFLTTKGNTISTDLYQELNEADLYISVITEIELFAKPTIPPDEEQKLRSFITDRLTVIDLTSTVKKETISIRRNSKLKLPDCIIAASAIVQNAVLLTADTELHQFNWPGYSVKNPS